MNLSALCINRPVFASVLSLLVLLIGLVAYQRLPVREYPNIDEPVVTVTINYRGAAAAIMESEITQPIEESISGIEGIKTISSISRDGRSQIRESQFVVVVDWHIYLRYLTTSSILPADTAINP